MADDYKDSFKLVIVVPVRENDGYNPQNNRYYLLDAEDIMSSHEADEHNPALYKKVRRKQLEPAEIDMLQWREFVERDVSMAHAHGPMQGLSPMLIGTYLVNLAAFGNKKRP